MSYQQTIYNRFRQLGMTEAGALAMLGNFDCESNCEPNRVQGDGDRYRTISKTYTANYSNGTWGKDKFVNAKTGYGLAQWTYPTRQAGLWDFWKASGKALDDVVMQCDFSVKELKQDFPELWRLLCTSSDVYMLTKRVCYDFENPLVKNVDSRYNAAVRIKGEIDLGNWQNSVPVASNLQPNLQQVATSHKLVLRTIDWHCESWPEFDVLSAILQCRGYEMDDLDDVWDSLGQFQQEAGLTPDKIAGPKTWAKLLEVAT